jgi:hypothetical protein
MLAQDEHASPHAQLEGLPGGRPWEVGTLLSDRAGICDRQGYGGQAQDRCPSNNKIIAYRYRLSNDYL